MQTNQTDRKEVERTWPNGNHVAVAVAVMYEAWPEGQAPVHSVQTTHHASAAGARRIQ